MPIDLTNLTLVHATAFVGRANTTAGSAGSSSGWGDGWTDLIGGQLSISGGRGQLGTNTATNGPITLWTPQQLWSPLIVVTGLPTSYFRPHLASTADGTSSVYEQIIPYANGTKIDYQGVFGEGAADVPFPVSDCTIAFGAQRTPAGVMYR